MEANQATAADVLVAEVESQSTAEQFQSARREAMAATTKLREQIGVPEYAALAEAGGDLVLPQFDLAADEDALIASALACRPEIRAAAAQVAGSRAAVSLAQADRIPIFSIGPAYEKDENGLSLLWRDRDDSRTDLELPAAGWSPSARRSTIATTWDWSRRSGGRLSKSERPSPNGRSPRTPWRKRSSV